MKKVFRALTKEAVEKKWIGDTTVTPKGWFESPLEAMEAHNTSRGPGRPSKAD